MNNSSKILIIGHDDIIENALYKRFVDQGYSSVASSTRLGLNPTIQPAVYDYFQNNRPEYLFIASTRSGGIDANQKFGAEFLYHNSESQNNLFYAAQKFGVKKIVYFAGSCVYPKQCSQPIKEEYLLTGPLEKTSEPYSIAKIAGIKLCESFKKQYGLDAVAMIPATIYGPGSDANIETAHVMGALIGKFARAISEKSSEVIVWGSGNARREFIYIDDFVDAALFLMEHGVGGTMVNAGCGYDMSIKELAELIATISGFKGKIIFDTTKPEGTMQKLLDSSQIKNLGWQSKVQLKDGIEKTYQWFVNQNKGVVV